MELDLSGVEQWGDRPFKTSIAIKGEVQNRAGIVTVRYDADYILSASCARCLEPVEQKKHQEFFHTVVRKLNQQEDDDYLVCEDGILDMDTLAKDCVQCVAATSTRKHAAVRNPYGRQTVESRHSTIWNGLMRKKIRTFHLNTFYDFTII